MLVPAITLSILLVLRPANVLDVVDQHFENILPAELWNSVFKLLIIIIILLLLYPMCFNTLTIICSN
jgi:hypothetical protein